MNQDYTELVKYLDEKFGKVDNKFNEADKRFDRLFSVFATKEDLKEAINNLSTKEDFNKLLSAVDAYAKRADTYFQEMVALSHKVDRHEKWIQQLAEKLGMKLEY